MSELRRKRSNTDPRDKSSKRMEIDGGTNSGDSTKESINTQRTRQPKPKTPDPKIVPNVVESVDASMIVIKRSLAAAVSTVLYARNVFGEDSFREKKLPDGTTCKVLCASRHGKTNTKALTVINFLQGAFVALEKRYLRRLDMGLSTSEDDADFIDEKYSFDFDYTESGGPLMSVTPGDLRRLGRRPTKRWAMALIKENVTLFIHRLLFIGSQLERFRKDREVHITFRLYYYEDRTPSDYDPPGFKDATDTRFEFKSQVITDMDLGDVDTRYHAVQGGVRSTFPLSNLPSVRTSQDDSIGQF